MLGQYYCSPIQQICDSVKRSKQYIQVNKTKIKSCYDLPPNLFLCCTPIKAYRMQSIDAESCTLHSSRLGKSDLLLTNAIDSHCLVFSKVNWMQLDILSTVPFHTRVKIIKSDRFLHKLIDNRAGSLSSVRFNCKPGYKGNVESCRQLKSVDWALQNRRHLKPPKTSTAKP